MDLKALLTYGNTLEKSDLSAKMIESKQESSQQAVNFIAKPQRNQQQRKPAQTSQSSYDHSQKPDSTRHQKCRNCGGPFPHNGGRNACPAKEINCYECGKIGHFARHCLSKSRQQGRQQVHEISQQNEDKNQIDTDEEFAYTINTSIKQPETTVTVAGVPIKVIVDSGSSVNILNNKTYESIRAANSAIALHPSYEKVFAYGSTSPMSLLGEFMTTVKANGKETTAKFLVTKTDCKCLISYGTSTSLGLLIVKVNAVSVSHPQPEINALLQKHTKLFEGTGKLKNVEIQLEIDESVPPVAQKSRRIPHNMKKKVVDKLKELKDIDIIEKVEGATPWLTPLIPIPKKGGDVRLVLDMRVPTQALKRRHIQVPTVDEILHKMEGSAVFTELDLSQGYLQISLAEESRYITAFQTPDDGPYRFKRLIMGACPSGEYFHEQIYQLIRHIPNCQNISDNIWIWSKTMEEHVQQLSEVLQTLENSGLTIKLPKCTFASPQINVFGHIVSKQGIQPDSKKVEAVNNAPTPKTAAVLRSFLGLTNYCSRYIPHYSDITYPLRQLLKENSTFTWGPEQDKSFKQLKQTLATAPVLTHYNLSAPTRLVVDASPHALGAVLLQQQEQGNYRPIAYGSRSLTETEMKYAHIEKEALAIVFGCEHFHLYLYGRRFELETDHRPLEYIFKPKSTGKPSPPRVERWVLRLQEYDFDVVYRPGIDNLADSLSRLPIQVPRSNMESCADRFVHFLAEQLTPRAMTTEEIREASKLDSELEQVRQYLTTNQFHKIPKPYRSIANELSVTDDIILRGNRIVLPTNLKDKAIAIAHEDHAGMTKCKQRIRSKLWWPNMDKDIEEHIKACHPCQITSRPERPQPIRPTPLPQERWSKLAIDVCGPFPSGESVVVLTDFYSRWPEATIIKSVTSANILRWLDSVFATHGFPEEIQSDNASYFTSTEFRETLNSWGVKPRTVTPYWPQANGQVERFNQVLVKYVHTSNAEGKDWKQTLPTMLRNYRTTPHQTTGETPAKLLMQREIRTKLPSVTQHQPEDAQLRNRDQKAKQQSKEYADSRRNAKPHELKEGDLVLIKQDHQNKYSTNFRPDPLKITKVKGSQIVMVDKGHVTYQRNASQVKKFHGTDPTPQPTEDIDEEDILTSITPEVPGAHATAPPVPARRSNRQSKPPDRLGFQK